MAKKNKKKIGVPELVHHHCFFWFVILPEALYACVVNRKREGNGRRREWR